MVSRFIAGLGIIFVVAIVVLAAGCARSDGPILSSGEANSTPTRVQIATVGLEDSDRVYEATGTVKPKFNSTLSSKVMARVVIVAVREGDRVRKGQTLVTLDSRELKSAVNMAKANQNAASVGIKNAEVAFAMEIRASAARLAEAEAQVSQAKAALGVARSRMDLAKAGTRTQEKAQAGLAVNQAKSNLEFATAELDRTKRLVDAGAIARRQLDVAQNNYNLAEAQHQSALEAQKIAIEGSRSQEIRAAEEAVMQAEAAVKQAEAGLRSAKASSMMIKVRAGDIQSAKAQSRQSAAALDSAIATAGYAIVVSPFDGKVVRRYVDPGTMAAPGAPLLVLEGKELRLEAVVPESVVQHLAAGKTAPVTIDALSSPSLLGKVVELIPQGDPLSHTFLARFSLPTDVKLQSGMFGRVQIPIGRQPRILIPESATWELEGLRYVFAVNPENIARLRIITVGQIFGDRLQVLTGLRKGERIIIGDRRSVRDGTQVEAY